MSGTVHRDSYGNVLNVNKWSRRTQQSSSTLIPDVRLKTVKARGVKVSVNPHQQSQRGSYLALFKRSHQQKLPAVTGSSSPRSTSTSSSRPQPLTFTDSSGSPTYYLSDLSSSEHELGLLPHSATTKTDVMLLPETESVVASITLPSRPAVTDEKSTGAVTSSRSGLTTCDGLVITNTGVESLSDVVASLDYDSSSNIVADCLQTRDDITSTDSVNLVTSSQTLITSSKPSADVAATAAAASLEIGVETTTQTRPAQSYLAMSAVEAERENFAACNRKLRKSRSCNSLDNVHINSVSLDAAKNEARYKRDENRNQAKAEGLFSAWHCSACPAPYCPTFTVSPLNLDLSSSTSGADSGRKRADETLQLAPDSLRAFSSRPRCDSEQQNSEDGANVPFLSSQLVGCCSPSQDYQTVVRATRTDSIVSLDVTTLEKDSNSQIDSEASAKFELNCLAHLLGSDSENEKKTCDVSEHETEAVDMASDDDVRMSSLMCVWNANVDVLTNDCGNTCTTFLGHQHQSAVGLCSEHNLPTIQTPVICNADRTDYDEHLSEPSVNSSLDQQLQQQQHQQQTESDELMSHLNRCGPSGSCGVQRLTESTKTVAQDLGSLPDDVTKQSSAAGNNVESAGTCTESGRSLSTLSHLISASVQTTLCLSTSDCGLSARQPTCDVINRCNFNYGRDSTMSSSSLNLLHSALSNNYSDGSDVSSATHKCERCLLWKQSHHVTEKYDGHCCERKISGSIASSSTPNNLSSSSTTTSSTSTQTDDVIILEEISIGSYQSTTKTSSLMGSTTSIGYAALDAARRRRRSQSRGTDLSKCSSHVCCSSSSIAAAAEKLSADDVMKTGDRTAANPVAQNHKSVRNVNRQGTKAQSIQRPRVGPLLQQQKFRSSRTDNNAADRLKSPRPTHAQSRNVIGQNQQRICKERTSLSVPSRSSQRPQLLHRTSRPFTQTSSRVSSAAATASKPASANCRALTGTIIKSRVSDVTTRRTSKSCLTYRRLSSSRLCTPRRQTGSCCHSPRKRVGLNVTVGVGSKVQSQSHPQQPMPTKTSELRRVFSRMTPRSRCRPCRLVLPPPPPPNPPSPPSVTTAKEKCHPITSDETASKEQRQSKDAVDCKRSGNTENNPTKPSLTTSSKSRPSSHTDVKSFVEPTKTNERKTDRITERSLSKAGENNDIPSCCSSCCCCSCCCCCCGKQNQDQQHHRQHQQQQQQQQQQPRLTLMKSPRSCHRRTCPVAAECTSTFCISAADQSSRSFLNVGHEQCRCSDCTANKPHLWLRWRSNSRADRLVDISRTQKMTSRTNRATTLSPVNDRSYGTANRDKYRSSSAIPKPASPITEKSRPSVRIHDCHRPSSSEENQIRRQRFLSNSPPPPLLSPQKIQSAELRHKLYGIGLLSSDHAQLHRVVYTDSSGERSSVDADVATVPDNDNDDVISTDSVATVSSMRILPRPRSCRYSRLHRRDINKVVPENIRTIPIMHAANSRQKSPNSDRSYVTDDAVTVIRTSAV